MKTSFSTTTYEKLGVATFGVPVFKYKSNLALQCPSIRANNNSKLQYSDSRKNDAKVRPSLKKFWLHTKLKAKRKLASKWANRIALQTPSRIKFTN